MGRIPLQQANSKVILRYTECKKNKTHTDIARERSHQTQPERSFYVVNGKRSLKQHTASIKTLCMNCKSRFLLIL